MERKDLLEKNNAIFIAQGKALDAVAKKTVKVCCFSLSYLVLIKYVICLGQYIAFKQCTADQANDILF